MFLIGGVLEKIQFFIQVDAFVLLWVLLVLGYIFYHFFLKQISLKRHTNLKKRFRSAAFLLTLSSVLSALHWVTFERFGSGFFSKISHYLAFFSLVAGCISVIKLGQIAAYLYLFFKNISQGIPRLIVNLLTVVFSLAVISFMASEIFSVHVTAMLATSAVFSLVLGLALQDTLGNLFSGVAMQMGQPYAIGDWIEVNSDSKKWIGQVQEITWRATFLSSFSDEWIMIPNKTMAQSQIIIFTNNHKVLRLSQMFRFPFEVNIAQAKKVMLEAVQGLPEVMKDPEARVLLTETTESWITLKIFYSLSEFSLKYRVGDKIVQTILEGLKQNAIPLATHRLSIENEKA